MPLVQTRGAASAQGFGEFAQVTAVNYIEEVFSTFLYTGNSSTQTITNGIDLAGKGGLVWVKQRDGTYPNVLSDSAQGFQKGLVSNSTAATDAVTNGVTYATGSVTSTGLILGSNTESNASGSKYCSWTFREQPKFFDVVTYTGTGSNTTIAHALGSVPGSIIVKRTNTTADWAVYHRSLANTQYLVLNTTAAAATGATWWNSTTPTSTVFSLGTDATVNASGGTYIAYIFAHDAGGFGLLGTDNVISCGSYTGTGAANNNITLGYEPQWVLVKQSSAAGNDWVLLDTMRGMSETGQSFLYPNTAAAEVATSGWIAPTATGFRIVSSGGASLNGSGSTYIYIAIRRGPMKVPTDATKVFTPTTQTGTGSARSVTGLGFPPDMVMLDSKSFANNFTYDKLRGPNIRLFTNSTAAETNDANRLTSFDQDGYSLGNLNPNESGINYANWNFRRAPSFFDEVCYTGTGSATTVAHNLAAVPELIITKCRGDAFGWAVYSSPVGNTAALFLETTAIPDTNSAYWNNTTPTSTVFSVGSASRTNRTSQGMVAYLFATCPGVSKVGSYTGTATTLQINCGFTAGARFVFVKRTDSSGDWYVWDSARGIIAGNDPYLLLNDTAAEVTSTDYIDTYSAGFEITSTAPAAINANGGTFIFLAIA
jgi:hypothetical protein